MEPASQVKSPPHVQTFRLGADPSVISHEGPRRHLLLVAVQYNPDDAVHAAEPQKHVSSLAVSPRTRLQTGATMHTHEFARARQSLLLPAMRELNMSDPSVYVEHPGGKSLCAFK